MQRRAPATPQSFNQRLDHILACATRVFCEKGYAGASMRDIARATGISLAGLYHYVRSKEELLFLIQKHTFSTLLENLRRDLASLDDPALKLRCLIRNHLRYFLDHPEAMKVLAHESESLSTPYARVVADLKRSYYRTCRALLDELGAGKQLQPVNRRVAVLSLFGMMNWIYTWYNPAVDGDWPEIADQMTAVFLRGTLGGFAEAPAGNREGE